MTERLPAAIAIALAAAAGVHLAVLPEHLRESAWHGGFFAATAATQAALAVAIVRRPRRIVLAGAALHSLAIAGVWAVSRTTGLPFGPAGAAEPVGVADSLTAVFQLIAAIAAVALLRRPPGRLARRGRPSVAIAAVAAATLLSAGIATAAPIDHRHSGSHEDHAAHGHGGGHEGGHAQHGFLHVEGAQLHGLRAPGDVDPGRDPSRTKDSPIDGVAVAVGAQPVDVAAGAGSLWVVNRGDATVTRIDPATRKPVVTINVASQPSGIAFGFGAVWVASYGDDVVQRIDPAANTVTATIATGVGPSAIVALPSGVWVATVTEGAVQRIDPMSLTISEPVATGYGPVALAGDRASVWVSNALDRTIVRVDVATMRAGTPVAVPAGASGLTIVDGGVWVTGAAAGTLTRVDAATGRAGTPIRVDDRSLPGLGPVAVVAANGRLWVANNHDKTIVSVDPSAMTAGRILFFDNTLAPYPGQVRLVVVGGALWVTDFAGDSIVRLPLSEGSF